MLVVVVSAMAVPVADTLGFGSQSRPTHHHVNAAVAIAVSIVSILLAIGVGLLVVRKTIGNPEGRFAPPILAGLPRGQRRLAGRNVRRATPSDDPTMAAFERDTAARTISQARFVTAVFGIAIIGEAIEAVIQNAMPVRLFLRCRGLLSCDVALFHLVREPSEALSRSRDRADWIKKLDLTPDRGRLVVARGTPYGNKPPGSRTFCPQARAWFP